VRNLRIYQAQGVINVYYDPDRIAGLTAEDLVEGVSAKYGTAARPDAEIILSATHLFTDGEKMILV
jgi:hypothetical protein